MKYKFEIGDVSAVITLLNVILIICGIPWAGYVGLTNNCLNVISNLNKRTHINFFITQLALIGMNLYFIMG